MNSPNMHERLYAGGAVGGWWAEAACASVDPELFFPPMGVRSTRAVAVCNRCPVLEDCRDYAVGKPWLSGVWGGLTEIDRQKIRAAARR